ncbi:patatin-like phospholipase RssA [Nitrosococcus oceani]|uniref:Patatin n=1 Tax=Nitrosococcus oceani (strain ATCC 19707 / BCRC 17464 / JCM 30415 / NCIMB 11848 / C-107) TaxID=323261 RepID=Q3JDW8_NITOC|nr:patatin-like phospholipase RssA [Nitrosococcus oceani]ABA56978.1 Patatin [Nitrosococcus oceani ATCC 19707]GEM20903.1 patatin [Nitrosococcus oceani]
MISENVGHGLEITTPNSSQSPPCIGIALGGGAARGWAHIGVLRALAEKGIVPDVVAGSSIGALVGAAYGAGTLDNLERWVRSLTWRDTVGFFDIRLRGGLIEGKKLFKFLARYFPYEEIQDLPMPFAAVATNLENGREVWLQQGSLLEAVRASAALPGLLTPVNWNGHWLVDGGLVNPVPVSVCRALGATRVIAVDLNAGLLGRRVVVRSADQPRLLAAPNPRGLGSALTQALWASFGSESEGQNESQGMDIPPSLLDIVANSINIMQVHITRSRLAGDPPDLSITPRLNDLALLDFHRAEEAIAEGQEAVARVRAELATLIR